MAARYGLRVANVFHAGDGNLHPLILYDANKPGELERAEAFGADILRLCVEVGGVLTGEHGVGVEKRDLMATMFNEIDLDQQQRLKCAFDPEGLLNPGKVFPQLHRCAELGRVHVHRGQARAFPTCRGSKRPSGDPVSQLSADGREPDAPRSVRLGRRRSGDALEIVARRQPSAARPAGRRPSTSLDLSGSAGIVAYEPEELVLTARAGDAARRDRGGARGATSRCWPSSRPTGAPLLGGAPGGRRLGGVLACNLAGPRRITAGAARDHLLGFTAVSGRGEAFKAGGQVVKNVTGYDLCQAAWPAPSARSRC